MMSRASEEPCTKAQSLQADYHGWRIQSAGLMRTSEDWPSFRVGGATLTVGVVCPVTACVEKLCGTARALLCF